MFVGCSLQAWDPTSTCSLLWLVVRLADWITSTSKHFWRPWRKAVCSLIRSSSDSWSLLLSILPTTTRSECMQEKFKKIKSFCFKASHLFCFLVNFDSRVKNRLFFSISERFKCICGASLLLVFLSFDSSTNPETTTWSKLMVSAVTTSSG